MRDYVNRLIASGQMQMVRREVNPRGELAAVVAASLRVSDRPILFEKVAGTSMSVVSNLYGSHQRLCELIGAGPGNFCATWTELVGGGGQATGNAGSGDSVDSDVVDGSLGDLPRIQYFERDAGPYITAGVFLAREPETGVPNLSFCRSMMVDDGELRVRLAPPHDLARYQAKAEARDRPLEVAILIGPPPEIFLAACASIPYAADELAVARRLRGGALPMRQCATIDLQVPVETEVVIEGRILPNVRRPEAPFGEFLGYYVGEHQSHVFQVTRVSYRRDPLFHALLCGYAEDLRSLEIAFASRTYQHVAAGLPGILDVSCFPCPLQTVVKISKQYEGHARQVMLKAFASHLGYNKICIVVDEDVNIHDFDDVWWAVVTRCRVDQRLMVLKDIPGFFRDAEQVHIGRLGIDATKPTGKEAAFERKRVAWREPVRLRDYVDT